MELPMMSSAARCSEHRLRPNRRRQAAVTTIALRNLPLQAEFSLVPPW